jgi:RloB-like protein
MKMKNKRAEEIAHREAQKAERKAAKERRLNSFQLERTDQNTKFEKERILIVCEGKNTEPDYFRHFKLSTATIKAIGLGYNTVSLVDRAAQLNEASDYDQVWCVFDKDDFSNFNDAIQKAAQLGFKTAWSNQAFEYWLLLHFEDHQGGPMDRKDYYDKINGYLKPFGVLYDRYSKKISQEFFDVLQAKSPKETKSRQALAIERAKRNLNFHNGNTPANSESSTIVYSLVEEILKFK